ncbi:TldD/PmbA family protein, partial [bacterium]|nr:TldD/PmbA family protein [bacterium]
MQGLSRREFMKKGCSGLAVASVPFVFRTDTHAASAAATGGSPALNEFYEMFGVDEALIRKIMGIALGKGGDYCDVFFQNRVFHYIGLEDNIVNEAYSNVDFGVGIRVLKGDQTGYSFTEEITAKTMAQAAETAASIANAGKTLPPAQFKVHKTPQYYPIQNRWETVKLDQKIPLLPEINQKVFSADKRIIKCRIGCSDDYSYILIANSEGRLVHDYQPMTRLFVSCTAEQDGRKEDNYAMTAGRYGLEHYTPAKIDQLVREAVEGTVLLFDAVKPEAGE